MRQIIYAWTYLSWGGAQMYTLSLIRGIQEEFDVLILLPEGSSPALLKFIEDAGVRYEFFSPAFDAAHAKGIMNKIRVHMDKWASERALVNKLLSYDLSNSIVHIEIAPWQSLFSLLRLCRRTRVFVTMHNSVSAGSAWRRLLWKLKLRMISRYPNFHAFTANNDAKECFRGYFSERKFEETTVTYACVDSAELKEALTAPVKRDEFAERLGFPGDKFLVFAVGQFIDRKGRWIFLEAARKVKEKEPDTAFVWIANSAPDKADLERAREYGLGDDFVFLTSEQVGSGHIELMELLRCADAFALPSYVEGLPISLLEAMALGVPCVSTRVNAIPEALENGINGLLVDPGDSDGLADAILELKCDPELAARLSGNAAESVQGRFTDTAVAAVALERYKKAFEG
jgi:glycosyltransferase involved in cell wall biosynthesis